MDARNEGERSVAQKAATTQRGIGLSWYLQSAGSCTKHDRDVGDGAGWLEIRCGQFHRLGGGGSGTVRFGELCVKVHTAVGNIAWSISNLSLILSLGHELKCFHYLTLHHNINCLLHKA